MLLQTMPDSYVGTSTKNSGAKSFRRCAYEKIPKLNLFEIFLMFTSLKCFSRCTSEKKIKIL